MKPGYRPPEDVEVYKNRTAEAWKNRGKGGVPGAASAEAEDKQPTLQAAAAAAKNAKRREARKKAAVASAGEAAADGEQLVNAESGATSEATQPKPEAVDPEAELAKEARKLAKKLRQARELKEKKEQGDNLLPEQFAKVIKMNELIRQLDNLGFDAEGEKKKSDEVAAD